MSDLKSGIGEIRVLTEEYEHIERIICGIEVCLSENGGNYDFLNVVIGKSLSFTNVEQIPGALPAGEELPK